jgi:peptidoglycan/LPS O-acetylase OafA/YrhL
MKSKERVLIFDLIRIASVAAIVLFHIFGAGAGRYWFFLFSWMGPVMTQAPLFGVFDYRLGPLAVYVLLFVSGAVLQLTHPARKIENYWTFMSGRFARIYPAFWIVLGISMLLAIDVVLTSKPVDILISIAGLSGAVGQWSGVPGGFMYTTFWFIGLIVVLYLMFPLISRAIESSPHVAMLMFGMVSLASMIFIARFWSAPAIDARWFPLCGLVWFALGVYTVRMGWYPKTTHSNLTIGMAAELTFYVFLVHHTLPFLIVLARDPFIYIALSVVAAIVLMHVDNEIHEMFFGKK